VTQVAKGSGKFLGATTVGHLAVFAPCNSDQLLIFDAETNGVRGVDVTQVAKGSGKFLGATTVGHLAVFAPCDSDQLLIFDAGPEKVVEKGAAGAGNSLLQRLMDVELDKAPTFSPIFGVMRAERMTVKAAAIATGVEAMRSFGFMAEEAGQLLARDDPYGLDKDQAGAIHLYTMESPLYQDSMGGWAL
jgi:hypothetical protein